MKGLTLTQPWAYLVAQGKKKWETRSWRTNYRGPIAIHAGKGWPKECRHLCIEEPFRRHLPLKENTDINPGPCFIDVDVLDGQRGQIIAVGNLTEIIPTENWCDAYLSPETAADYQLEKQFGDYSPNRFAWRLENVVALKEPIPCKGALMLWGIPPEVQTNITKQLSQIITLNRSTITYV